ncbi:AraC family transcriptional regulator ligand-binding domain-containing protein [Bosea sp. UC22_33]|uniref:AraC family transcriptional regulator n=1 Tax=Bosea sp. UC22_33 TaxID=3350165 RepID=UPI00366DE51C
MFPPPGSSTESGREQAPTAVAVLTRLAAAQLSAQGIDPEPRMIEAGLSLSLLDNPDERVPVRRQIAFLNIAADDLDDDLLGFHLAQSFDLRALGFVHYIMASAETLAEALTYQELYGAFANEAMKIREGSGEGASLELSYIGVERHLDRHQAEFWLTAMLRQCRLFTGRELVPTSASMLHSRPGRVAEMERYFGLQIDFGADLDLLAFARDTKELPLTTSDHFLKELLAGLHQKAFPYSAGEAGSLRTRVENAIMPRLRHGTPKIEAIARDLGTSARTLTRRLADLGISFSEVLDELRYQLAVQYLRDGTSTVSQVTWLLGYREPSASVRAFKRWTGKTPTAFRRELKRAAGR